jgi:sugar phosphate isomerase/epimerase
VAVENHDRFSSASLLRIIEETGCYVCLDTANSLGSLEGIDTVVDNLAPHTLSVHVKDVRAVRESHNMGFRIFGTAAGNGQLDIPNILARVVANSHDPSVIVETWPHQDIPGIPPLTREAEMAEQSIRFLKSLPLYEPLTTTAR